jgi:hypothetical protein
MQQVCDSGFLEIDGQGIILLKLRPKLRSGIKLPAKGRKH